jgi:hypothetical protein
MHKAWHKGIVWGILVELDTLNKRRRTIPNTHNGYTNLSIIDVTHSFTPFDE